MNSASIDYLSFSVDLINKIDDRDVAFEVTAQVLQELLGFSTFDEIFVSPNGWEVANGQRPYTHGYCNIKMGVFVWYGGHSTALVQFSGNGCKQLDKLGLLFGVLASTKDRLTRLDLAIDIVTSTSPVDFVSAGYNKRIKSYGEQRSTYGETCYLGSRVSQKFCRVYRYSEPHPRSHMLRIEYELKKSQARIAAQSILENGVSYATDQLSKYYEWEHEENPLNNQLVEKMQSEVTDRSSAKTLTWLLKQCAPAFKKLVENGTIEDPVRFLEENFLESDNDNE